MRSTAETVYEFVKRASGKGYRRFTYASPGDRNLNRKARETLDETFTYDPETFALYKTNADDGPTNDNVAVPFWRTQYFRSRLRFIVVALLIGGVGLAYGVSTIINKFGSQEEPVATAVHPVVGLPVSASRGPEIFAKLPMAEGVAVIVKDGGKYKTIVADPQGRAIYNGRALPWPSDF